MYFSRFVIYIYTYLDICICVVCLFATCYVYIVYIYKYIFNLGKHGVNHPTATITTWWFLWNHSSTSGIIPATNQLTCTYVQIYMHVSFMSISSICLLSWGHSPETEERIPPWRQPADEVATDADSSSHRGGRHEASESAGRRGSFDAIASWMF